MQPGWQTQEIQHVLVPQDIVREFGQLYGVFVGAVTLSR